MVDPCFWAIRSTQCITNNSQFYSTHNKCVFVVLLVPTYDKHRRQSSRIIWKNIQEFVRVRQAAPMLLLLLKQCSAAQKKSCPPKCSILFGARCLSLFSSFLGEETFRSPAHVTYVPCLHCTVHIDQTYFSGFFSSVHDIVFLRHRPKIA